MTPIKLSNVKKKVLNTLMSGSLIRIDGVHNEAEIIPREYLSAISHADNLFQHTGSLVRYYDSPDYVKQTITVNASQLVKIINELEEEYIINKFTCSGSGCCQYHTYGYYLENCTTSAQEDELNKDYIYKKAFNKEYFFKKAGEWMEHGDTITCENGVFKFLIGGDTVALQWDEEHGFKQYYTKKVKKTRKCSKK